MTKQTPGFTAIELIDAAFSSPIGCLVAAILVATAVLVGESHRRREDDAVARFRDDDVVKRQYRAEHTSLALVALMVLVVFVGEFIVRGYLVTGTTLPWWRFATPLLAATIGSAVVSAIIATRGMPRVTEPMPPTPRRGWRSFSSRRALTGAAAASLLLIVTTLAAGSISSADDDGRYAMLAIAVPNAPEVDPLRFPFYGWAYGVPVLVALTALVLTTGVLLHLNAARRFQRTATIAAETIARKQTARASVALLTAVVLLGVAEAWRQIADVGNVSLLTIMKDDGAVSYETPWRFAELAAAFRWGAPVLEVVALAMLLILVVSGLHGLRVPTPTVTSQDTRGGSVR